MEFTLRYGWCVNAGQPWWANRDGVNSGTFAQICKSLLRGACSRSADTEMHPSSRNMNPHVEALETYTGVVYWCVGLVNRWRRGSGIYVFVYVRVFSCSYTVRLQSHCLLSVSQLEATHGAYISNGWRKNQHGLCVSWVGVAEYSSSTTLYDTYEHAKSPMMLTKTVNKSHLGYRNTWRLTLMLQASAKNTP